MEQGKRRFPKLNSINYGGIWILSGLIIGVVLPIIFWFVLHKIIWILVISGGVILASFAVLFAIEMHQDFASVPYYEKHLSDDIKYDSEKQYAVIRSSICTGEKVAGFKNKADGHFIDVMLIRSPEDELKFKEIYNLDSIKTEY